MKTLLFIVSSWLLIVSVNALDIGADAPDFTFEASTGKAHRLSDYKGKFIVLEWSNYNCPFVKKHYGSGNMQKLQKTYTEKGVIWLTVNSNKGVSKESVEKGNSQYKHVGTAYLLDESGSVGKSFEARTTPHIFILDKTGKLIYKGAVDSIASHKAEDIDKATNYIAAVLEAAAKGKVIEKSSTKPYGCGIKYKR